MFIEDILYFYIFYYCFEEICINKDIVYGEVKDYKNVWDEYFGKLIWVFIDDILINIL